MLEDPTDPAPREPDGPEAADDPETPGEAAADAVDADAPEASEAPNANEAADDAKPVWGPPAERPCDAAPVFADAPPPFDADGGGGEGDQGDGGGEGDGREETLDFDSSSPPLPPQGTPLRLPAVRARRPGILAAVLRAGWEELNYPRARLRAGVRRAANRMRERRLVASIFWATLAGTTFILYATGVGATRGTFAWTIFAGVTVALAAGGPAALVHAWPAAVAAPLVACAWAGWAFGLGALWLGLATCSALLVVYFAAAEVAPLVAAAGAAWLALHLTGLAEGSARIAVGSAAFVTSAAILLVLRKRVTAPIVGAGWVVLSGAAAARVTWWTLGASVPAAWAVQVLPGPKGLTVCIVGAAFGTALFSWPRRRETMTQSMPVA